MAKEIPWPATALALFILMIFAQAGAAATNTLETFIVIDPGHGGDDAGLVSATGLTESQVTLELADMIRNNLSDQYQVLMTRTSDSRRLPEERTEFANQNRPALYLCIHLNTCRSQTAVIYYSDLPSRGTKWETQTHQQQKNARGLASLMVKTYQALIPETTAELSPAPLIPLEGLLMPGILIEPFSIDKLPAQPEKRRRFLQPYADASTKAVLAYLESR